MMLYRMKKAVCGVGTFIFLSSCGGGSGSSQATSTGAVDSTATNITNLLLDKRSANCGDYVGRYQATANDIHNNRVWTSDLTISVQNNQCVFVADAIPNHDFNDGSRSFHNTVAEQDQTFHITTTPTVASSVTSMQLGLTNAVLLNGVVVDLLAAECYGYSQGQCHDISTPWRLNPLHENNASLFATDSHHAHAQPDGTYHYHGSPNALYEQHDATQASPVIGFAADGFPIYGPYIEKEGAIRKVQSSYQIKSGQRPSALGNPTGRYDGTYRDDYTYVAGAGDLDECNGMMQNGQYGYYLTSDYPYVLNCFKGTPDASFYKQGLQLRNALHSHAAEL